MLVFRASTNCLTAVVSKPQQLQISPHMFSRGFSFRFRVWRHVKLASLIVLYTSWTAEYLPLYNFHN
jgi:hypothetical protein